MSAKSQPKPKKEKAEGKTFVKENTSKVWPLESLLANCQICTVAGAMRICGSCKFNEGIKIQELAKNTRDMLDDPAKTDQMIENYWRIIEPRIFQIAIDSGVMDEFMVEV